MSGHNFCILYILNCLISEVNVILRVYFSSYFRYMYIMFVLLISKKKYNYFNE